MKKVIILLAIIALFGCEKETCWECVTAYTAYSETGLSTLTWERKQIYCGNYTKSEVEDMECVSDGIHHTVICKELD